MPGATIKKGRRGSFLRPIKSIEDLMMGKNYVMHNGQLIFKNGKGYAIADVTGKEEYTRDDYMQLPEEAPFQLIKGKLTHMPSPKEIHQNISIFLSSILFLFIRKNKLGKVWAAPFDVHFDEKNIFQPDLLYVSNERLDIVKDWVYGAPDLVVEIISPGSEKMDSNDKMEIYGKYQVKEYWLIDPSQKTLEIFENKGKKMKSFARLIVGDKLQSKILKGLKFEIADMFK